MPRGFKVYICCDSSHYGDVTMGAMASQIAGLTLVYSTVYLGADQRNIKAPHKWQVTRKMFPFDDIIMYSFNAAMRSMIQSSVRQLSTDEWYVLHQLWNLPQSIASITVSNATD